MGKHKQEHAKIHLYGLSVRRSFSADSTGVLMPRPAVNVAVRAARAAGAVILRYMNRVEGLAVEEKARHDYVSEVDRMAEAEIVRELRRAYPDHAVLGEETGRTGKSDKVWLVDPLDGTHNYLRGFPISACRSASAITATCPRRRLRPVARRAVHGEQGGARSSTIGACA